MRMLTRAGAIGPSQRLIVRYRTQLDDDTQDGAVLTNVAGAIQWFNGDSSNPDRVATNRTLTNGTVGVADHEDAHTVTVALTGFFFEKTAANLTTGVNPTTTAAPGDTLRYTLRFRTTDQALNNFRILDDLGALNPQPAYVSGSLALVTVPPGANTSNTSATGGTNGTGVLDIRSLNLPADSEFLIQFDITLAGNLANGTVVTNQSTARLPNNAVVALSDDPDVNGTADPLLAGDEDPTRVTIQASPAFLVQKISTDLTGDPNVLLAGETLRYTITVKNIGNASASGVVLRDAVPVNTAYVAGTTTLNGAVVPDSSGLSPLVNGMLIHSPADATPGSMPPAIRRTSRPSRLTWSWTRVSSTARSSRTRASSPPSRAASSTNPPTTRTRRSPTIRRATSSATSPCSTPKSGSRCPSIWARRASWIRATRSATRSRSRTRPPSPPPALS
jgi:uncharacterized repeat protein (TIGR01451 family)